MNKPADIVIEHELPEPWRSHVKEVLGQVSVSEGQITRAKATILDATQDRELMRKHLGVLVSQLVTAEHLPPDTLEPYSLSEDGTKIVGRVKAPAREGE